MKKLLRQWTVWAERRVLGSPAGTLVKRWVGKQGTVSRAAGGKRGKALRPASGVKVETVCVPGIPGRTQQCKGLGAGLR